MGRDVPPHFTTGGKNQVKTYGVSFTFAGTEFTTTGLLYTDAVSSVTLTSAGAAATGTVAGSPYAITPSAAVGPRIGNYIISYASGTLTVNPGAAYDYRERPDEKLRLRHYVCRS